MRTWYERGDPTLFVFAQFHNIDPLPFGLNNDAFAIPSISGVKLSKGHN